MIDHKNIKIEDLNRLLQGTMSGHLEMEVTELGPDYLDMRMPVNAKTIQPYGVLNGGASMALAESAASLGGNLITRGERQCVGLEINGNHVRAVRSGSVTGRAKAIHVGKRTQIWEITIRDDDGNLVCISRMTLAVLDVKS
ncbi:MAG: hotdog fold thioesterase [Flavobacteriales bacterium]|nr:hotdog fold thioesterase [Flavobacteriales bacterium]